MRNYKRILRRFSQSVRGASLLDYAILFGMLTAGSISVMSLLGSHNRDTMMQAASALAKHSGLKGLSSGNNRSCASIHDADDTAPSGVYPIDPDGSGPLPSVSVWCDMVNDGGGWTLVSRAFWSDHAGWSALAEMNASRASGGPGQTGTFRLSDTTINAIRGSGGIYRLSSDGAFTLSRFFGAYTYAHNAPAAGIGLLSYPDFSLSGAPGAGTTSPGCKGLSDYPLASTGLFFVTNGCSGSDMWLVGPGNGNYRSNSFPNANFTMWVRDK